MILALVGLASTASAQKPVEVHEASITELQRALREGRTTSAALVDAYLARIAAYDQRGPVINSMIRLNPRAREEARQLDVEHKAGKMRGPLHGIPIILKDNYDTKDMPTSGGSLSLANHQTSDDAFVVQRLRNAGAVILGKANMHELAAGITSISSLGGQTRNPYDPRRCPGGSSGGTGAAIAASFAAVGWGSDTCGSIRIPSAFGSLVGLRPTQGMVSRTGIMPLSHTQDIGGPLARTMSDLAIALDATVGEDAADAVTHVLATRVVPRFTDSLNAGSLKGARIGVLLNYFADADADILDTVRAAVRTMRRAGADTVSIRVADFDSLLANSSLTNFDHKYDLIDYLARTPGEPIHSLRDILDGGLESDELEGRYKLADSLGTRGNDASRRALAKQAILRERMIALMDSLHVDVLAYPTMRRRPALIGELQGGSTCALSAQTGLPALTVPAGFTADGLPVGIEMMGRPFSDAHLVSLGYAFEQLGPRRRAPFATPALVAGRAPGLVAFAVRAGSGGAATRTTFVYDRTRGELRFETSVTGANAGRVRAVVLRRRDATGAMRVVQRLAGPALHSTSGVVYLAPANRAALFADSLVLTLVSVDGVVDTVLRVPGSADLK